MANKKLSAVITIGGTISNSLKSAFKSTKSQLADLGKSVMDLNKRQKLLGKSIQEFGRMGKNVDGLRASYASVGREIDKLRLKQDRLRKSQARGEMLKNVGGKIMGAGVSAGIGSAGILGALSGGIKESEAYDTEKARLEALGMGKEVNEEAFKFAKDMKTTGTSMLENMTLVRDALSIFSDIHHTKMAAPILADMKYMNSALFGAEHGEENEQKFMDMLKVIELRGGTKSDEDFSKQANMIQKVISATGGRVGAEEWRHVIGRGGVAAMNMRDDAFFYQLEPLVQMMTGNEVGTGLAAAYNNLYQGHTSVRAARNLEDLGLIADKSKVVSDKAGQVKFLDPGALKGADIFNQSQYEWVKKVLLPTLEQNGITDQQEIMDTISSIVTNKTGAKLLSQMVKQQQLIDKDEARNRNALDIGQGKEVADKSAAGKQLQLRKRYEDLQLKVGNQLLPTFIKGLELASSALDKLNGFMEKNPELSKGILITLGVMGAALAILAPILVTVAAGVIAFGAVSLPVVGTIALIAAGIVAVGVAAWELYKVLPMIGEYFTNLWHKFTGWLSAPNDKPTGEMQYDAMGNATGYAAAPETPAMPAQAASAAAPVTNNYNSDIKITQQPGQDSKDLAKQVLDEIQRQASIRQRSMLFDGAGSR
jgi:hypothetical protein